MSNYPRDEFDTVEENSARHGVHRASMEPHRRSLMPLMIFGVAALCVGLLAYFIMPQILNTAEAPATVAVETPTPEPTPEPTLVPEADNSNSVAVFNATGIPGLAAQYAGHVTGDGWPVSQSANWAGQPQPASAIFYSDTAQKANAEALSKLLNIPTVVETAELGLPLAVVLALTSCRGLFL